MTQKLKTKLYKLLKWSEKYTKTDMIYLARGGFWLTLGQIVSSLSAFALSIAFANLLPKETYGEYRYILSIASILAIPTLTGMGTAVTQAVARGYEGVVTPAMKEKIKWGLLSTVASWGLAGYYWVNGNSTLTFAFLICGMFLPFMNAFGLWIAHLNGKKRFDLSSKYGMLSRIGGAISMLIVLYLSNNIFLMLFVYFLSTTFFNILFFFIAKKKLSFNKKIDFSSIGYGKHLSLMNVIGVIANQIDKILLWHFLGAVELAIYIFALAIPEQIKIIFKNIQQLALPKFSNRNLEDLQKTLYKKIINLAIPILLLIFLYIASAPIIYKLFFPEYTKAIFYSQIFSISLLSCVNIVPYTIIQAHSQTKKLYIINTATSISQIILFLILIPLYGLMGAILARIINRFFIFILSITLLKKNIL